MTAHVNVQPGANTAAVLRSLEDCARDLGVQHNTFQICNPCAALQKPESRLLGGGLCALPPSKRSFVVVDDTPHQSPGPK